ncbi:MAG TPA: sulfotransferase domain-containing protein [Actinomycetota bacterium]|jgi:hypothetical protein
MRTIEGPHEPYSPAWNTAFPLGDDELEQRDAHNAPTVLYIGGCGRSGTTLLARMLGQVPQVSNVGEVRDIWLKGRIQNRLCGCGARFSDCPFWTRVGLEAFGGWDRIDAHEMVRLRSALDRPWLFPLLAARGRRSFEADVARYTFMLDRLYRAIRATAGVKVIVDASKFPTYSLLLRRADLDVRLVHVVRDSRGVAHSWQKKVAVTDSPDKPIFMPRYGLLAGAALYAAYNLQTELIRFCCRVPYLFLRYEDLVKDPDGGMRRVLAHAGLATGSLELPFLGDGNVRLEVDHTVMGNPIRMKTGALEIARDDGQVLGLERTFVSAVTLPLLVRYGYLPPRPRTSPWPRGGDHGAPGSSSPSRRAGGAGSGEV